MWADRQTYLEYHRNRYRERVNRWHSLGLCIMCGADAAPFWRCFNCRLLNAAADQKAYQKRKQGVQS